MALLAFSHTHININSTNHHYALLCVTVVFQFRLVFFEKLMGVSLYRFFLANFSFLLSGQGFPKRLFYSLCFIILKNINFLFF